MTVNSTRDFIPPEPFEGQNYKPRYARPSASLREEILGLFTRHEQTEILSRSRKNQGDHVLNSRIDIFTSFNLLLTF